MSNNDNYSNSAIRKYIKVKDLEEDVLNNDYSINFEKTIKYIRGVHKWNLFVATLMILFTSLFVIKSSSSNGVLRVSIFVLIFLSFALAIIVGSIIKLRNINDSSYKKIQYGELISTYRVTTNSADSRPASKYYADVLFSNNVAITKVRCNKEFYISSKEHTPVMIVSFDNKVAYAVSIDSV
ncbi:MAG: hypothetical protein ACRC5M_02480 [Anaeroplasmataceae bacterium]